MIGSTEKEKFLAALHRSAPDLNRVETEKLIVPELVTSYVLELPKSVLEQAQAIVQEFFRLRKSAEYQQSLESEKKTLGLIDPGHYSIAMSYDFHLDSSGDLRLVEINTNAAFLAMAPVLYEALGVPLPIHDFSHDEIRANIENEIHLMGADTDAMKVSIVDENPPAQKLYAEFLLYQSLMRRWGWDCEIHDVSQVAENSNFVYNRSTDFYLQSPSGQKLRQMYVNKKACVSPNPFEYLCLADKNRMIELSQRTDLSPAIQKTLLRSVELTPETSEELWAGRKKFFFKPLRAYGGKQSYRGENISHRMFDELVGKGIIAQQFCPPPEIQHVGQKFKYDLRIFAYMDRVQCAVTRLYQGQLTNLKTPGGGFGAVRFIS